MSKPKLNREQKFLATILILSLLLIPFVHGAGTTVTIVPNSFQNDYSFLVFTDGTTYYMKNGTDSSISYFDTNSTLVEQYAHNNLTGGGVLWLREVQWNSSLTLYNNVTVFESYQGKFKVYNNLGNFLIPQLASDPSTVGWGASETGRLWYNTADKVFSYWNTTDIVTIGSNATADDDSMYLFLNGTRTLTADWNTGAFAIYGASWMNATSISATSIYCTDLDALVAGTGVHILNLIVENGTSFPASPKERQVFYRSELGYLYIYNNSQWIQVGTRDYSNLTGTPDLTAYIYTNGTNALTGNWNVGGAAGIYGATWVNATNINVAGNIYFNQYQAYNMTFWSGAAFPASNSIGQPFYRTDLLKFYVYNGTDWVELGAQGATGPAGSSGSGMLPISYEVFVNATATYMINGTTGAIDDSNANSSRVANNAFGNISSSAGTVYFRTGTYSIDAPITVYKKNHLYTEPGTVFNVSGNLATGCIVIDSSNTEYTDWRVEGVHINMSSYNGCGIYSSSASRTDGRNKQSIYNVYVEKVAAGYAGIYLVNAFYFDFSEIRITTSGTGVWLALDNNLISGNGVMNNIIVGPLANNVIGLRIDNSSVKYYNLMTINHFQCGGASNPYTNTIGVLANGLRDTTFVTLNLEYNDIGLLLNNSIDNTFENPFIIDDDAAQTCYGVLIANSSYANHFFGGYITCNNGMWAYSDNSTATYRYNMVHGTRVYRTWNPGVSTRFDYATLWDESLSAFAPSLESVASYTYLIGQSPSYYYMQNGTTGRLDYYSTNATKVIQFAIGNSTGGGRIFVKDGDYTDIHIAFVSGDDDIVLEAESWGVHFTQSTNTIIPITLESVNGVVIRGFNITGASGSVAGSQSGIWLNNTKNCLIEKNYVANIAANSGSPYHTSGIQLWYYNYNCTVRNNWVVDSTYIGISVAGGSKYNLITENHVVSPIDNCLDTNGDTGLPTGHNTYSLNILEYSENREGIDCDDSDNNLFTGNIIRGMATTGFAVGGTEAANNTFSNNFIDGDQITQIGITVSTGADGSIIKENTILNIAGSVNKMGIYVTAAVNTTISGNNIEALNIGVSIYNGANFTSIRDNTIISNSSYAVSIDTCCHCQLSSNWIRSIGSSGVYLKLCWYTGITDNFISMVGYRPLLESATGIGCDYNLLDGNMMIGYTAAKTWGAGGHDVTGDNLEVQIPT